MTTHEDPSSSPPATGKRTSPWWFALVLVVVVGATATAIVSYRVRDAERHLARLELTGIASLHAGEIQREIDRNLELVAALSALFAASSAVDPAEFHAFADHLGDFHEDVDLLAFVSPAGGQGTVRYVHPPARADAWRGRDIAGAGSLSETVEAARETNARRAAAHRVTPDGAPRLVVAQPVRGGRPASASGTVLGIFRIDALLGRALEGRAPPGLRLIIERTLPGPGPRVLHDAGAPVATPRSAPFTPVVRALYLPGERWTARFAPGPEYFATHTTGRWRDVTAAGIALTAIVGLYVFLSARASARARKLSLDLAARNKALNEEIARRQEAQEALRASEVQFRRMAEEASDLITLIFPDGEIRYQSPSMGRVLGHDPDAVTGTSLYDLVHPDDADHVREEIAAIVARAGGQSVFECRLRHTRGQWRYFETVASSAAHTGARHTVHLVSRDVDDRKRAEADLKRTNRALTVLSSCNLAIVQAEHEEEMINRIPRILLERGRYALAWIALIDERRGVLEVAAQAGMHAPDPQATFDIPALEEPGWVVGDLMRGGFASARWRPDERPVRDPFHARALARGWESAVSLTLRIEGDLAGALTVFAEEPGAFESSELHLLEELAGDVGFGLKALRTTTQRDVARRELIKSESRLRAIVEGQTDAVLVLDAQGSVLFANPAAERLFGRPDTNLVQRTIGFPSSMERTSELQIVRPDRSIAETEMQAIPIEWAGRSATLVTLHDISERRSIEHERLEHAETLQRSLVQTIEAMARTIEKRDSYTAGHQQRVARLTVEIGRHLGVEEERLRGLRLGAMIHDIGKIHIPSEILNRPGRVSASEYELIKTHPSVGYEIVKDIDLPWPIAEMVHQHHERLDGTGYPQGLSKAQICQEARILAVADVVEAIASHRPYRPGLGLDDALLELREHRDTRYDGAAVDACLALFTEDGRTAQWLLEA